MKIFKEWLKRRKIKKLIANYELDVDLALKSCEECEKYNLGIDIYQQFQWPTHGFSAIGFDEETNQILVNEQGLMRIIQIVNPVQEPRKIRLVSQDEFYKNER